MAAWVHQLSRISEPAVWPQRLKALLAEELAPSPRKFWTSLRLTAIATVGVGLIAICHVSGDLGSYIVWLVIGAGPMMPLRKATAILIAEGVMLASSVAIARALAETPWLMLPFIFAFMAASTFITVSRKLGSAGLLIEVVSLASFYGVVFAPREIGWAAAGNFGGTAIAFGLVVLFDNWLWPDRAEPILLETLRASAARHCQRLEQAARFYLDAGTVPRPQEPPPASDLPQHLALFDRAVIEGLTAHHRAVLLAAVTRMARIQLETDRLIIAAREDVPRQVRAMMRPELEKVVEAIGAALDEIANDESSRPQSGLDRPPSEAAMHARLRMNALSARITQLRPTYIRKAGAIEVANLASFIDCLGTLVRLLERPLDEPPPRPVFTRTTHAASQTAGTQDPMLLPYSLKVGLCSVAGYVIGVTSQRPELSVILTTVVITALPTYGASLHKMILRMAGSVLGGLISLLAIIIVTPNFETLPAYLVATFVVLYVSAYSSLSSGRIAYAGKQIGTTFLLVFAGLSPSADVYGPLWRIWGILLGTVVVTIVFFIVWPQYARDSLLPRIRQVIRDAIALAPGGRASAGEFTLEATSSETMHLLSQILEIADDARLEGRASVVDYDAVVQAAGTLRRIANRLTGISMGRIAMPLPQLDEETESSREAVINGIRTRLGWWLARFEAGPTFRRAGTVVSPRGDYQGEIASAVSTFSRRLEAQGFARINSWTLEQRRTILNELQSLSRLEFLIAELDGYLSATVGRPAAGRPRAI